MKTKSLLTIFGVLNILQGLFMFLNGRSLTMGVFPGASEEAIMIGEQMHMPLGSAFVGIGFLLLICRSIDLEASRKLLFSYAVFIGFALLQALYNHFTGNHSAPQPIIITNLLLATVSLYGYSKGK